MADLSSNSDSEQESQPELHDPGSAHRVQHLAEVRGVLQIVCGNGKINVVEDVEDLPAKLKAQPLAEVRGFGDADVKAFLTVGAQHISPKISEPAEWGDQQIRVEEPLAGVLTLLGQLIERAIETRPPKPQPVETARSAHQSAQVRGRLCFRFRAEN